MLPRVPGDGSAENSELCQANQGRPRELQRPAEPEAVLELPKEGKRNLPKTLKPRVRLRPIYQTNPTCVLLPGAMKVSTNRQFHVPPQRKGWRLPVSWPPSESRRQQRGALRPRSIAQPRSFPQPRRTTSHQPRRAAVKAEPSDSFTPPLHLEKDF